MIRTRVVSIQRHPKIPQTWPIVFEDFFSGFFSSSIDEESRVTLGKITRARNDVLQGIEKSPEATFHVGCKLFSWFTNSFSGNWELPTVVVWFGIVATIKTFIYLKVSTFSQDLPPEFLSKMSRPNVHADLTWLRDTLEHSSYISWIFHITQPKLWSYDDFAGFTSLSWFVLISF